MTQMFLIIMNFIMSWNFTLMNHPLAMGLILLIQTILISLLTGLFLQTFWFSYILFLIMLGGMLVLFIYMTSLASNELFSFSMKSFMLNLILLMMISFLMFFIYQYLNSMNSDMMLLNNFIFNKENNIELIKLYNSPTMLLTLMLINYLFLTLIIVVKITNINQGPLRQSN
uniref:NADH-ubiquinone oxidoreductase chain 6 n=1 Tax=Anachauliodes laboissierei TaxID=1641410 RepID=A0A8K1WCD9_9NEOP|nr:NADH dehydrogenase subunit 6 [Anachauliodes laboissierei]